MSNRDRPQVTKDDYLLLCINAIREGHMSLEALEQYVIDVVDNGLLCDSVEFGVRYLEQKGLITEENHMMKTVSDIKLNKEFTTPIQVNGLTQVYNEIWATIKRGEITAEELTKEKVVEDVVHSYDEVIRQVVLQTFQELVSAGCLRECENGAFSFVDDDKEKSLGKVKVPTSSFASALYARTAYQDGYIHTFISFMFRALD